MLILTRRKGERIMIGDDIVITILETRGDRVRIGIAAPSDIPVHREEVYKAVQADKQESAGMLTVESEASEHLGIPYLQRTTVPGTLGDVAD